MTTYMIRRENAERDWDALQAILDNDGIVGGDVVVLEQIAKCIRAQIPKPAIAEPEGFGSIVRAVCLGGSEHQLWQRSSGHGKHYWESESGVFDVWSDLTHVEVLRVGIGEPVGVHEQTDAYTKGAEALRTKALAVLHFQLSSAITAERKDAYEIAIRVVEQVQP